MISYGKCTKAQYEALTPVQDRIYYITDTGEQFLNGLPYNGEDNRDYLCLTAETDGATVGLKYDATPSAYPIVWHSADRRTWTAFEWTGNATDVATLANAGDRVYLRAFDGDFGNTAAESTNLKFSMTGTIAASGNVMSLLHGDDFETRSEVPTFGFQNLFRGCASLVEPPEMPATKLGVRAYYCMFYGCALRHCPGLPARTLTQACYGSMFGGGHQQFAKAEIGASSFEADPDFPLSEMAPMNKMFKGCSSLATVTAHFELWSTTDIGTVATNWLQNTSTTGVFKCPSALDTTTRDASHVPAGWTIVRTDASEALLVPTNGVVGQVLTKTADGQEWADAQGGGDVPDATDYLCFTALYANTTISVNKWRSPYAIELEYSTDRKTWNTYTWNGNTGASILLQNAGDYVCWRGNNSNFNREEGKNQFASDRQVEVSGNIMSLVDKTCASLVIPSDWCFYGLFNNTDQNSTFYVKLPAIELKEHCYQSLFTNKVIKDLPLLPAKILKRFCYKEMFEGNSRIMEFDMMKTMPNLMLGDGDPLYEQYACEGMFKDCGFLKTVKVFINHWGLYGNVFTNWLQDVGGYSGYEKVFHCPSALDCSTRDASHVPAGWTIVRTDSPKSITSPTTSSSSGTYEVSPNTASVPVVTVASALTLSATAIDSGSVAYAEVVLDIASGATVTAGTNLTLVDTPTAGKRNVCVVRWSGGVAKLYVTIVEDLPQA